MTTASTYPAPHPHHLAGLGLHLVKSDTHLSNADGGPPSFGDRVRLLRRRAGLTQEELAEHAGLSVATIAAIEEGRRQRPHPHTLRCLIAALGLTSQEGADLVQAEGSARRAAPTVEMVRPLAGRSGSQPSSSPPSERLDAKPTLPPLRPRLVPRQRWLERPHIAASASSGKTMLVAVWVSLDDNDSDPARLWSAVVTALQSPPGHSCQ